MTTYPPITTAGKLTDFSSVPPVIFRMKAKSMKAILWDGHKKINGELILDKKRIQFRLADFGKTDLDFDLAYKEIKKVSYHKLYEMVSTGLEIVSENDKCNIFIVEEPATVKAAIQARCELFDIEDGI